MNRPLIVCCSPDYGDGWRGLGAWTNRRRCEMGIFRRPSNLVSGKINPAAQYRYHSRLPECSQQSVQQTRQTPGHAGTPNNFTMSPPHHCHLTSIITLFYQFPDFLRAPVCHQWVMRSDRWNNSRFIPLWRAICIVTISIFQKNGFAFASGVSESPTYRRSSLCTPGGTFPRSAATGAIITRSSRPPVNSPRLQFALVARPTA